MKKVLKHLRNESFIYITINILVAILGFVRSFAFIKFFGFGDLGLITMVNTASMLITFFQLGTINGGYRIIALGEIESIIKTNNNIFSYLGLISFITIIIGGILVNYMDNSIEIVFVSVFLGIFLLFNNWLTNRLIASKRLVKLNVTNLISAILGLLCLGLVPKLGLSGAFVSLLIQPLIFVLLNLNRINLPTKFQINIAHIKYILSFGFIPYLSGIFYLMYMQIERWSINLILGKEQLGGLYIFFLVLTVWTLIPTSIMNIFFPQAIRAFADGNMLKLKKILLNNLFTLICYLLFSIVVIIIMLNPIVGTIFPEHLKYTNLVYFAIPGLVFKVLGDPLSLFFNSIVKLRPIFWSEVISLIIYASCVLLLYFTVEINLEIFIFCFDVYFFVKFIYLFICFYMCKNIYFKL